MELSYLNNLLLRFFFLFFSSMHVIDVGGDVVHQTFVVDRASAAGHFTSISAAIAAVPSGNSQWTRILIAPGVYNEKTKITIDKPFIILEGSGAGVTTIEWGDSTDESSSNSDTAGTATFTSQASDMVAKGITFKNTFSGSLWPKRAVAAIITGDRSSFYGCNFVGIQDTLCDGLGRHYFKDCRIEGYADFIWGFGQSIYENCNIATVGNYPGVGYVTAQGKYSSSQAGGFVFKYGSVTGTAKVHLGRAWGAYSTVIFYKTSMSNVVVPQGWNSWGEPVEQLTYAEVDCTGPGAALGGRVPWEKTLSSEQLSKYISFSYIDSEEWIERQPS